jgi:hypothetical protein
MVKENGIVMLTLPPHTLHKFQPFHCTVFGPYKTYYEADLHYWKEANITIYSVALIIGKPFSKAFTKHNTQKGFNVTEIYLLNANVFMKMNSCPPISLTDLTVR